MPSFKSGRRQIQKEETRRIILAAAYSLFKRKGYENTTMRELAQNADVGLGTIFKHFPDKPSLLISAFREDLETVVQDSFNTLPRINIKMQLAHIAAELYGFLGQTPSFSRSLVKETLFLQAGDSQVLKALILSFHGKIEKLLLEAIDRAELDGKTDCRVSARAFLSFLFLGLLGGLREPEFNVRKQVFFLASLLEQHFAAPVK